ncbi:MFS transporter (plasmid) [Rhodococcus qingshengii]|uniref:MFS transporter n=1 Tax=Rhodococcus qingshengii TaxID=334542 RepID=UPI0007E5544B|nr:MFS transporter [Rhodococcus qingshengii]BCF86690.1 MFS transporter [Rhodococcus qingshengii]
MSDQSSSRRVLLSSLAGTTLEWYEFFIYGTAAALVFNKVFFPSFDSLIGTLLSLTTFAVAFVARPVGAVVCGHFGDRLGRKKMLVITLIVMGVTTFAMGLLPGYATIGIAAPILLVVLRLIQGLSLGGEYSGAVLMSVEHAGENRRGLFGAIINAGAPIGLLMGNGIFLAISFLDDSAFIQWGWRIPFISSALLVFVGMYMRLKVEESPEFARLQSQHEVHKTPLLEVLRSHGKTVLAMSLSYIINGAMFYTAAVFSLTYGENHLGVDRSLMLTLVMIVTTFSIGGIIYCGWLSDRFDRKKMFLLSIVGLTVAPIAWFALLDTRSAPLMLLGFVILYLPYCLNYGTMPTLYAQAFPAHIRYSGMGLGYTIGTILGSAIAPLIATYLLDLTGGWAAIAVYLFGMGVISFISASFLPRNAGKAEEHRSTHDNSRRTPSHSS